MLHALKKLLPKRFRTTRPSPEQVRALVERLPSLSTQLEYLQHNRQFRVDQVKPEFLRLLQEVQALNPADILEIGGRRGGSSLMLSFAAGEQARVLTLDLNNGGSRLANLLRLCAGRSVQFWQADSHANATFHRVQDYLQGRRLDVLFIDGDHSYQGAKQDFLQYTGLVRAGGLVALHDVQQDYRTRFGIATPAWTGGVPDLWQEIRAAGFDTEDLIADPDQDGYGIGLVRWAADSADSLAKLAAHRPTLVSQDGQAVSH